MNIFKLKVIINNLIPRFSILKFNKFMTTFEIPYDKAPVKYLLK